jgi:hypothetical protein
MQNTMFTVKLQIYFCTNILCLSILSKIKIKLMLPHFIGKKGQNRNRERGESVCVRERERERGEEEWERENKNDNSNHKNFEMKKKFMLQKTERWKRGR